MRRYAGTIAAFACGILLFLFGLSWQDTSLVSGAKEWVRIISNAALLPGVLMCGLGLLVRIAGEDAFAGIHYATMTLFIHLTGRKKKYDSYFEYLRRERKKGPAPGLMLPGCVFLGLAVVLTGVYYLM